MNYLEKAVQEFIEDNGLVDGEAFRGSNGFNNLYKVEKGRLYVNFSMSWDESSLLLDYLTGKIKVIKLDPIAEFLKKHDLKENEIFTTLESNGNGSYKIKDNQIYFFILGDRWAKTALTISKLETFGVKKIDPITKFMNDHDLKEEEPFTDGDSLPYRIKDNRLQYIKISGVWANSSLTIYGFDSGVKIEKVDIKAWMVKTFTKKHDIKDGERFYIDKRPNECIKYFIEDNVIYHLVKSVSTWMDIEPEKLLVAKVEKIDPLKEKLEKFMKDNNLRDGEVFGSGCPDHEYKIESGVLYYKCYKGPALDNPWIKSSYCNELDIDCFLNSKVFILPPKPFKPKKGEQYWYFNNLMKQVTCSTNNNGSGELLRVYHGMAYRTKQEAEANKAKDLAIYESVKQDSEPKPDKLQDVPNCKYCTAPITESVTNVFGKSVQNGVPTPDSPVGINSVTLGFKVNKFPENIRECVRVFEKITADESIDNAKITFDCGADIHSELVKQAKNINFLNSILTNGDFNELVTLGLVKFKPRQK